MLDNLRDDSSSRPFFEDEAEFQPAKVTSSIPAFPRRKGRFLGMTSMQRFVIAVMLMLMVCLLGAFCSLATGKMGIYF
jgi:hypothetical protein